MTPKKITTKSISKNASKSYFIKAQSAYNTMKLALEHKEWDAVGLNGIQASISAADAILALRGGLRHTSQDHNAMSSLLIQHVKDLQIKNQSARFSKLMGKKNEIQYLAKNLNEKEAIDIFKQVERFVDWAMDFYIS